MRFERHAARVLVWRLTAHCLQAHSMATHGAQLSAGFGAMQACAQAWRASEILGRRSITDLQDAWDAFTPICRPKNQQHW